MISKRVQFTSCQSPFTDTTSQLGLFVDGQLRISTGGEDSPTMVTNDLVIQGNVVAKNGFEISGDSLVLGTPPREVLGIASSVGLLGNGSVLFLNRLNEFPGGVVLGDHHFAVRRSSPTSVQATIGGVPPSGTLRSAGSVRSASGFPSLTSTSVNEVLDSGFAFDEHSQTGFFAENSGECVSFPPAVFCPSARMEDRRRIFVAPCVCDDPPATRPPLQPLDSSPMEH